jgi:hypothetical protein
VVVLVKFGSFETRPPREKLTDLLEQLQTKRSELMDEITTAGEREHQARIAALTANPGQVSTAKGSASQPYKIREATVFAERRLIDVEREILAVTAVIADIDTKADAEARADEVRREAERQAHEAQVMAERKASGETYPAPAAVGAPTAVRRSDPGWRTARSQAGAR